MMMFQQRTWQLRMLKQGKCRQCGKDRDQERQLCESCRQKQRASNKKYRAKLMAQKEKNEKY